MPPLSFSGDLSSFRQEARLAAQEPFGQSRQFVIRQLPLFVEFHFDLCRFAFAVVTLPRHKSLFIRHLLSHEPQCNPHQF
jgi:hypothetical protein